MLQAPRGQGHIKEKNKDIKTVIREAFADDLALMFND